MIVRSFNSLLQNRLYVMCVMIASSLFLLRVGRTERSSEGRSCVSCEGGEQRFGEIRPQNTHTHTHTHTHTRSLVHSPKKNQRRSSFQRKLFIRYFSHNTKVDESRSRETFPREVKKTTTIKDNGCSYWPETKTAPLSRIVGVYFVIFCIPRDTQNNQDEYLNF